MKFIVHRSAFIVALLLYVLVPSMAWAVRPPAIYTTSLPAGQNGVAYSATIKAKFGSKPYAWSIVSGALPDGLSIGATTGIISGSPTVNNTFAFTVRLTDSEAPAKTDDQGLFITITGAAPAPTPAVSITTGSLPSGQVSVAYTTTLQATGGTAPYTWSNPSCSGATGCLPAGLSLAAATGVISGTPTAAGTYSFTIKVTDSSATAQTYSVAYAVTIAASSAYIWKADFEGGTLAAFDSVTSNTSVQSVTTYAGTYAMRIDFFICNDTTDPACGAAHQGQGRYGRKYFNTANGYPNGLGAFYLRGFVRFHVNAGGTPLAGLGRKLFYFFDSDADTWHSVFGTTIGESSGLQYRAFAVTVGSKGGTFCEMGTITTAGPVQCGSLVGSSKTTVSYLWAEDAWYYVEVYHKPNTPAAAGPYDGAIDLWVQKMGVDPAPINVIHATGLNFRTALTTGIGRIQVGEQVDRQNWQKVDEIRFWDNLQLNSTGPIGP